MKKKKRIEILEKKVEKLEKDLEIQKYLVNVIFAIKSIESSATNTLKPFEPVKLETFPTNISETIRRNGVVKE